MTPKTRTSPKIGSAGTSPFGMGCGSPQETCPSTKHAPPPHLVERKRSALNGIDINSGEPQNTGTEGLHSLEAWLAQEIRPLTTCVTLTNMVFLALKGVGIKRGETTTNMVVLHQRV